MVEMKKQGKSNEQSQSFFFILMMESFDMFQLTGSFSTPHFQLLTVFGILRPGQVDRTIEILGISYCKFPTVTNSSADGVCIIWQGCKQGVHF
jgi:hypothetical protein